MATRNQAGRVRTSRRAANAHERRNPAQRPAPRNLAFAVGAALFPWALSPAYADVAANTLPTGGQYAYGSGSITQDASKLQVTQTTDKGTINWTSFSIGSSAWVNFTQPSASSITVNRVLGTNPSEIFGRMTANGQVFLSNPNGVLFAPGASVDVGALFATTLTISDQDANAGRYNKWSNPGNSGAVVNQGSIITANGYTALAAPQVRNDGVIVAHAGTVTLAAGNQVSLDMIGDGLIKVTVDEAALNASAINTGSIQADGGNVLLTARSANALLDTVVNNTGVIRANSLVERNGHIVLDGSTAGVVGNTGMLQAAGTEAGTTGGTVKVLGQYVGLFDGTRIDASGDAGGGTVLVGGNFHGAGPERNATATYMGSNAAITADAINSGDGGKIAIWSDGFTSAHGTIYARGSDSGAGGQIETSGHQILDATGIRGNAGKRGSWLFDPDSDVTITTATLNNADVGTGVWAPSADTSTIDAAAIKTELDAGTNVTVTTTNATGTQAGNITVQSAITHGTIGGPVSLTLDAGTGGGAGSVIVNAPISATDTANPLNVTLRANNAGGGVQLNAGGDITTFNGNVNIVANSGGVSQASTQTVDSGTGSILVDGGGGSVNLAGTLTTTNATATAVTVQHATTVALGDVGATGGMVLGVTQDITGAVTQNALTALNVGSLTVSTGNSVTLPRITTSTLGAVRTNGNFSLADATGLDATAAINSGTGSVVLATTAGSLNLQAAADITAGNAVNLTGAAGIVTAGNVTAGNNVNYNSAVTLSGPVAIDSASGGGNITFAGTLDGAQDLTLTAGAGDVSFLGTVGLTPLGAVVINNARNVTTSGSFTAASFTQNAGTGTTVLNGLLAANNGSVSITNGSIAVNAGGIGAGNPGADIHLTASSATGAITVGAQISADRNIILNADGATSGAVSAVGGGSITATNGSVTISAGKDVTLNRPVVSGTSIDITFGSAAAGTFTANSSITPGTTATVTGGDNGNTFNISSATAANLVGGTGDDVFKIDAALTGSVNGNAGSDTLQGGQIVDVTLTLSGANGYSGTNTGISNGFSNIDVLTGTGAGTLTGENFDSTWALGASKTYNDGGTSTLNFSGFPTLQGGIGVDRFNVTAATSAVLKGGGGDDVFDVGASLTGSIDGEAGSNTLQGTQITDVTLTGSAANGYVGSVGSISSGFSNIRTLTGSGSGTLTGEDQLNAWLLGATNTYDDGGAHGTLTFSGFGTLQGGANIDTFTLTGAAAFNLKGGAASDALQLAGNTLTGSFDGEGGGGAITGISSAALTTEGASAGFNGTSAQISTGFSNITAITGTGTLQGRNVDSTWSVDGGTYNDGTVTLNFSGFPTLQGGTGVDTFNLGADASAKLKGGAGIDVFALAGHTLTGAIDGEAAGGSLTGVGSVTLTATGTATGFKGQSAQVSADFDDITDLQGSGTLTGTNNASGWSLAGTSGTYTSTNSLTFSGYGTLQGGSAVDTFTLTNNATFVLKGGDGVDVFALAGHTLTGSVDGETNGGSLTGIGSATISGAGGTTGYNGTTGLLSVDFSDITDLQSTGGTLTGTNNANSWSGLNATSGTYSDNGGSNTTSFSGFGTLQGGSAVDTFTLSNNATFALKGGAGVDVLALAGHTLTGAIDGEGNGGSITGLVNVALSVPGTTLGYAGSSAQVSGNFDNITDVQGTGTLTGTGNTSGWSGLNATSGTYSDNAGVNTVTFGGFATLQGGGAVDTFTLSNDATFALKGAAGADVFALAGHTLTGAIDGEANGGSVSGISSAALTTQGATIGFNGTSAQVSTGFSNITSLAGDGTGALQGRDVDSTWSVDGGMYSDGTRTLSFSGFPTLQGGSAIDTFNLGADVTATLRGGAGIDVFALAGHTLTGAIDGEAAGGSLTGVGNVTLTATGTATGFKGQSAQVSADFDDITDLQGSGTLTGTNNASGWSLAGTSGTYTSTNSLTFSGYGTLQGGSAVDTFTVGAASTFVLKGGAGNDVFNVNAALNGSADGEAGSDTLAGSQIANVAITGSSPNGYSGTNAAISGGFTNIDTITGAGGGTITGETVAASNWTLAASKSYDDNAGNGVLTFSGFGTAQAGNAGDTFTVSNATAMNLTGGTGADAFNLNAALTGSIDGGAGSDTLQGTLVVDPTITGSGANGYSGTLAAGANLSGGFSNVNLLNGTGTITGETAAASNWTLAASKTYNDNAGNGALTFSGFATAQSGSAGDIFTVSSATAMDLNGGTGADTFTLNATLTGAIDGGGGSDTLQGARILDVTLASSNANGFSGSTDGAATTFAGVDVINGAGGGTLTGEAAASTWALDGTPTYSDGATMLAINGFATLQAGSGGDAFNVTAASNFTVKGGNGADTFTLDAALTGLIDGGAGSDTLQGTLIANPMITGSGANGYSGTLATVANLSGGFNNIDVLGGTGTITGETARASNWTLAASKTYDDNAGNGTLTFSGFGTVQAGNAGDTFTVSNATAMNLVGGAGADTFNLNAALTGSIDGGAGGDTLQGTLIVDPAIMSSGVNGYSGTLATSAGLSGGFSNIDVLSGTGTITGETAAASAWTLGASKTYNDNAGNGALTFSGFGTALGGNAGDTFTVSNATTMNLSGGTGNDTFAVNALLTGSVNGGGGANTLSGSASYTVTGANTGTASNLSAGFSNIGTLQGTVGADIFTVQNAGTLSGGIDGLAGTDTLDLSGKVGIVSINLQTGAFTGGGTFTGIESFVGNDGAAGTNTTLTGPNAGTTFTVSGANAGTAGATTFSGVGNLVGGTGTDTLSASSATWNLTGTGQGTVTNLAGTFAGMENLADGGTGTFNMGTSGRVSGSITSGTGGTISYLAYASPVTFNIAGGASTGMASWSGITNVAGSANNDTVTGSGATYNLTGQNVGNSGTLSWTSFENITDASGGLFNLSLAANNVTGTITSGGTGPATCQFLNPALCGNLNSDVDVTSLNVSFGGMLQLSGNASSWTLTGAPLPSGFGTTSPQTNVFFNGACVGGPACGTVITITGSIGATVSQIATQALQDALDTDSVQKQIEYGFAGDVGTTPPMDHRIDETGISTPECFQQSREGEPCP